VHALYAEPCTPSGMLYFAYGSNMDQARLRERVPSARLTGIARLDGYRLAFTRRSIRSHSGVADIISAPGFAIMGIAFEVDDAEIDALDRAEGLELSLPAYRRLTVSVRIYGRTGASEALAYRVVRPADREIGPQSNYLDTMLTGLNTARAEYVAKTGTATTVQIKRLDDYCPFYRVDTSGGECSHW
jgi:cation transport regulator ChaC